MVSMKSTSLFPKTLAKPRGRLLRHTRHVLRNVMRIAADVYPSGVHVGSAAVSSLPSTSPA